LTLLVECFDAVGWAAGRAFTLALKRKQKHYNSKQLIQTRSTGMYPLHLLFNTFHIKSARGFFQNMWRKETMVN